MSEPVTSWVGFSDPLSVSMAEMLPLFCWFSAIC